MSVARRTDAGIIVYDVATGHRLHSVFEPVKRLQLGLEDTSDLLEVSPDGTTLAVGDGERGRASRRLDARRATPTRRADWAACVDGRVSHDSTMVAAGYDDGTVLVWDVNYR